MHRLPAATLAELTEILGEQIAVFETLLDLSHRKREVLVNGGRGDFEAILDGEQALLWQAGKLENRRMELQQSIAAQLNLPVEEVTMSAIIAASDPEQTVELRRLQKHLSDLLADLDGLNAGNARLLQQSLDYINIALSVLGGAAPDQTTYRPDGRLTDKGAVQRLFTQHA